VGRSDGAEPPPVPHAVRQRPRIPTRSRIRQQTLGPATPAAQALTRPVTVTGQSSAAARSGRFTREG
jgi:hypothetical protein